MLKGLVGIIVFIILFIAFIAAVVLYLMYKGIRNIRDVQEQFINNNEKRYSRTEYMRYQMSRETRTPLARTISKAAEAIIRRKPSRSRRHKKKPLPVEKQLQAVV